MLEYIPLYTDIWSDRKLRNISPDYKKIRDCILLFIYLLSNKNITFTGIYELDIEECKQKARFNSDFNEIFNLIIKKEFIKWDEQKEIVWVINRFKRIPTTSKKVIMAAIKELNIITHPYRDEFIKKYTNEFQPFYPLIKGYEKIADVDWFYNEDNIRNMAKIWSDRQTLKEKLMNRGAKESRLDEILPNVVPWMYKK